jgi:glycosyltransferase involved in cell wall biosynthesis
MVPESMRRDELPPLAVYLCAGCPVIERYMGSSDCAIDTGSGMIPVAKADMALIRAAADYAIAAIGRPIATPGDWTTAYRLARGRFEPERCEEYNIVMVADKGGCGYWRMRLPAEHLCSRHAGVNIDVTPTEIKFEHLLAYDTVMVQRTHDWDSYYALAKLKRAGKRIIYDMDDDLFSIEPDNPAFSVIGLDQQAAALACMKLANTITVSTRHLAERIEPLLDDAPQPVNIHVIPNSIGQEGWTKLESARQADGIKRILWSGSAAHENDWMECIEAVDAVLKERTDTRLLLLGHLPKAVEMRIALPHWEKKVEFMRFGRAETYFDVLKCIRAHVGIAPLRDNLFNRSKSSIKWLEYTLAGIPTVASNVLPYSLAIGANERGFLAGTVAEWKAGMDICLEMDGLRDMVIPQAREYARMHFDIEKVGNQWLRVLCN